MPTLKVNGRRVTVDGDATILDAARAAGVAVPTLCNFDGLEPWGGCRLCVVDMSQANWDDDWFKVVTACNHPVEDGMTVVTDSERIIETRRVILDLHPFLQTSQAENLHRLAPPLCPQRRVTAFAHVLQHLPRRLAQLAVHLQRDLHVLFRQPRLERQPLRRDKVFEPAALHAGRFDVSLFDQSLEVPVDAADRHA